MEATKLDEKDRLILSDRVALWIKSSDGPRVGDWCEMPDGTTRRFAHDWGKKHGIQITSKEYPGSFYFTNSGHMDHSGGLEPSLPFGCLTDTFKERPAPVWFFHHDHRRAHNGVHAEVVCRVYRYTPKEG